MTIVPLDIPSSAIPRYNPTTREVLLPINGRSVPFGRLDADGNFIGYNPDETTVWDAVAVMPTLPDIILADVTPILISLPLTSINLDLAAAFAALQQNIADAQGYIDTLQGQAADAFDELGTIVTEVFGMQQTIGDNTASIVLEAGARVDGEDAIAGQILIITATMDDNTANITQEMVARSDAVSALAATITTLTTTVDGNVAQISDEQIARSDADSAQTATIDIMQSTVDGHTALIADETLTRQTENDSLTATISEQATSIGLNSANIIDEASTRTTNDTALSGRIDQLNATVITDIQTVNASITSAQVVSTDADTALAGRIDTVTATVTTNNSSAQAAMTSEIGTRSTNDSALGTRIDQLTATVTGDISTVNATITGVQNTQAGINSGTATSVGTLQASMQAGSGTGNIQINSEIADLTGYGHNDGSGNGLTTWGRNLAGWFNPNGVNTIYINNGGTPANGTYADWTTPYVPAVAGTTYEASVYCSYHRAIAAQIYIEFSDINHTVLSYGLGVTGGVSLGGANGDLTTMQQIGGFALAPTGTAFIRLFLRTLFNGTGASPFGFYTHPFMRVASQGQTILSKYTPGPGTDQTAAVASNLAFIQTVQTAYIAADAAAASVVSTLKTEVDGHASTLTTQQNSINGLSLQFGVVGTLDGGTGSFTFQGVENADGTASFDFIIDANVTINGSLLVNGSAPSGKISLTRVGMYSCWNEIGFGDTFLNGWTYYSTSATSTNDGNGSLSVGSGEAGLYLLGFRGQLQNAISVTQTNVTDSSGITSQIDVINENSRAYFRIRVNNSIVAQFPMDNNGLFGATVLVYMNVGDFVNTSVAGGTQEFFSWSQFDMIKTGV